MSLHTVAQLKDSVAAILSGIDLSNVDNLNGALERSARVLVQKADVPEACLTQNIVLYGGVYDYTCDPRIFGTAINDIRPQGVTRNSSDYVYKRFGEQFDRTKGYLRNGTMTTFEYFNGVPIIRIVSKQTQQQIIIDTMTDTTGWVAAGSASNLVQDNAVYYQQPASMRFTLTGSSAGTLTKTLPSSINIESYEGVGVAFLAINIPSGYTASNLTNMSVKLGSSASDYNVVNATEGFLGAWVSGDWLLVAYDFSVASTVGSPDWSAIDYIQITLNHTATFINFRVGGLWISQPTPAQILSQSAAIFLPSGSQDTLTTITLNTDTIILNDPAYSLYEYESAIAILEQTGAGSSDSTYAKLNDKLSGNGSTTFGLYGLFKGDNPSQEIRLTGNYYDGDQGGGYLGY